MRLLADIELAFRKAWLFLYTRGVGPDYVAALEDFVSGTIALYRRGYSLERLRLELIAQRRLTGNALVDNNLALNEEELAVRDLWLRLVYLTLEAIGESGPPEPIGEADPRTDETGVQMLVDGVARAYQAGYSLDSFKLEMALEGNQVDDPEQAAILSQWMRIIFLTLRLRETSE